MPRRLLQSKLSVPPRPASTISRTRLTSRLDSALSTRLTLVSAPAGSGKTTLLTEWLAGIDRRVAWLSLDDGDNDLAVFMDYFIAALRTFRPGIGRSVLGMLAGSQRIPVRQTLTPLLNEMRSIPEPFLLVLDDYHVIQNEDVHGALDFLLGNSPPSMHLVIATRSDPALPLAKLRGRGQLTELRLKDLRFTPDEVAWFLTGVMGLEVAPELTAEVEGRTEGWITGVQMAAISMKSQADIPEFVRNLSGTDRNITDYLFEEVFAHQPEDVRMFLLHTSNLERLTARLCNAVTQREDSSAYLEMLERNNLFLIPLDERRQWFRYHSLFRDLLSIRLRQEEPDSWALLNNRASEWFEREGLATEAITHALSARDFTRASRLIAGVADAMFLQGEIYTFLRWTDAIPAESVQAVPGLCVYYAAALLISGQNLPRVEGLLKAATQGARTDAVATEASIVGAFAKVLQGKTLAAPGFRGGPADELPDDCGFLRALMLSNVGRSQMMEADVSPALQTFSQLLKMGEQTGSLMFVVIALRRLAEAHIVQGHLRTAERLYEEALESATDESGRLVFVGAIPSAGFCDLLREQDDLDWAIKELTRQIEAAPQGESAWSVMSLTALARAKQAKGDSHGASAAIRKAERLASRLDRINVNYIFAAAHRARLDLLQGNIDAANAWAEERKMEAISEPASPYSLHELEALTLARIRIAQHQPEEALDLVKPLLDGAMEFHRGGSRIETLVVQALAHESQGNMDDALTSLLMALELAEPEGYVRVFADEGQPMARLLYEASSRRIMPQYVGKLLAALSTPASPVAFQWRQDSTAEPLRDREKEVLSLIAEGLSNKEIAARLHVAVRTVKWHTGNIYGKLGVKTRTQAVARARLLGIILS